MAGVYLSFPFCSQKCTFCNFASGVFPAALEGDYSAALAAEVRAHPWRWTPDTVYLGGGTPSSMPLDALAAVLCDIPGRPWREATIEAAPGTVTPDKAQVWRDLGITRVSLGVQSFVPRELARIGRKHTAQGVEEDVGTLRAAGIHSCNLDLIAGLPHQTLPTWHESLDWIERLAPDHVSVYLFEVDEESRLGAEVLLNGQRYGAPTVPSDDLMAELYEVAVRRLAAMGIPRYEISNFARPGAESLHNLKYWQREPYIGFGADAHSFDGAVRSQNVESPQEYVVRWQRGEPPVADTTPATPDEERFFLGLRLSSGIQPEPAEWARFAPAISRFVAAGLLNRDGPTLRLTDRGVLLSNEVFAEFINA